MFFLPILCIQCLIASDLVLQEHEQWWGKNVEEKINTFHNWLGSEDASSRVKVRQHVKEKGYESILDIPCGLCDEFFGYKKDAIDIKYYGVDITSVLVERAKKMGLDVILGSIENIPYSDSSIDMCYARHILEHLSYYEKAISELIRVAKKEVVIIFFKKPHFANDFIKIVQVNSYPIYHNIYDKKKLSDFVLSNKKVKSIFWEDLNQLESILYVDVY